MNKLEVKPESNNTKYYWEHRGECLLRMRFYYHDHKETLIPKARLIFHLEDEQSLIAIQSDPDFKQKVKEHRAELRFLLR